MSGLVIKQVRKSADTSDRVTLTAVLGPRPSK